MADFWDAFERGRESTRRADEYKHQVAQQAVQDTLNQFKVQDAIREARDRQDPNSILNQTEAAKLKNLQSQGLEIDARRKYYNNSDTRDANTALKNEQANALAQKKFDAGEEDKKRELFYKYRQGGETGSMSALQSQWKPPVEDIDAMIEQARSAGTISAYKNLDPKHVDAANAVLKNFGGGAQLNPEAFGQPKSQQEMRAEVMTQSSPKFQLEQDKARDLSLHRQAAEQAATTRNQAILMNATTNQHFKQAMEKIDQQKADQKFLIDSAKNTINKYKAVEGVKRGNTQLGINQQNADTAKQRADAITQGIALRNPLQKQLDTIGGALGHLQSADDKFSADFKGANDGIAQMQKDVPNYQQDKQYTELVIKRQAALAGMQSLHESPLWKDLHSRYDATKSALDNLPDKQTTKLSGKPVTETGGRNLTLDRATAQQLLQEAGGDKDKARELARKRGFQL